MNSQKTFPRVFSCEYFPPKDDAARDKLYATTRELAVLKPKYFSVTYGAGGSTQAGTYEMVKWIKEQGLDAAPHISCVGATRATIVEQLQRYKTLGIKRIVALGGDLPSGMASPGEFRFAYQLVELIRKETGDWFHIEVAAYPEMHPRAANINDDLKYFRQKVAAGASAALTQYFYNPDAYVRFVYECEKLGLKLPVVPGIMPITNYKQLARFSDACGAEIPRWIRKRLEGFGDDLESLRAFGLDVTTQLCEKLLAAGAPGLHFYTMNRATPTREIWNRLGLK
ncbi:MAG: methylenetetrahydrofolate reductase [NAD(P)H] [Candidatus Muproteobacteria bacterium RBG_16_64_10]|uniref:Methylenetetrahydrofolate reductase n=1 Tax=Candidatus Muproteobacteria bacterium RBG_16_64_10 TaxID=1817757 RepID=A0A1F6SX17_9PROT|nr:MAG: methylenetetrahydrofolate reductase [NAD(P)H] [Candidatus Muproteobacteria bacterium RBG_16_64_10]